MKIELNQQDCQNVRISLLALMKSPQSNEPVIATLLALSDKFIYREDKKEDKKEDNKEPKK